ncbi:helix-turn-helix transcriptional regulator [Kitasatospora sp. NPDC093806]|uniref:helix-turn-helix transcriptional regulator n=1 Tax=Kitasatospora sp. NPDC093806 TaxID=3155075 RepID=UPI00341BE39F
MNSQDSADGLHWLPALRRVGRLTLREREVFALLADGPTNLDIAGKMFITERTVRAHIVNIQAKLGLNSRLRVCLAAAVHTQRLSRPTVGEPMTSPQDGQHPEQFEEAKEVNPMKTKKPYQAPKLTARGTFATATAGFGRIKGDQLVGRLIP